MSESQQGRPEGEDHREGPPGYDLDEQAVYEQAEGGDGGEKGAPAGSSGEDDDSVQPPD